MKPSLKQYSYPAAYYRARFAAYCLDAILLVVGVTFVGISLSLAFFDDLSLQTSKLGQAMGILDDKAISNSTFLCAIGLFVGWLGGGNITRPLAVSVVPLYAARLSTGTLLHGEALARNAGAVDEYAKLFGVMPLSDFGYYENVPDFDADIWYAPADVLPTLTTLISAFRENRFLLGVTETPLVLSDLECLQAGLTQAEAVGIPFRFLLRYGNGICAMERVFDYGYF